MIDDNAPYGVISIDELTEELEINKGFTLVTDGLGFKLTVVLHLGDYEFSGQHRSFEDEEGAIIIELPHEIRIQRGLAEHELHEVIAHEVYHLFYSLRKIIQVPEEQETEVFGELVRHVHKFVQDTDTK